MRIVSLLSSAMISSIIVMLVGLSGCHLSSVSVWDLPDSSKPDAPEIEEVRNLPYYTGSDSDDFRNCLDLYLPKTAQTFPVVILVHGGAWTSGDNRQFGLFSSVGKFLAQQGIGAVLPNYRLAPDVKHPEHVRDVARAVAWTHRHIADYGGNPEQLFLAGHSAGGHLVTLLGTDDTYLKQEGLQTANIKGVISVSGVYRIAPEPMAVILGGNTNQAVRLDQFLPLRYESDMNWTPISSVPIVPLHVDAFSAAFGDEASARLAASPVQHVRPGLPPFLLFTADRDLPTLTRDSKEFQAALIRQGGEARLFQINKRNHHSIMFRAVTTDDPVASRILEFVRRHSEKEPRASAPASSE